MNTIKKISILLFLFIIITKTKITFAQVPQGINYQSVIRSSNGDPVVANASTTPQNIHCEVSIYMGNQPGQAWAKVVYGEKHLGLTTNNMGIVNFVIGGGNPTSSLLFENIDWSTDPYYFQLEVDRDGTGTNFTYENYGYQEFVSVPFTLHAKVSDSIAGVNLNNIGSAGLSAYEIAVQNGFIGTEAGLNVTITGAGIQADPYLINATDNQNLTGAFLTGTSLDISIEDGNGVSVDLAPLQDGVYDADSDSTNEIELPTNANVGDILKFDGNTWVSAFPSSGVIGAGAVMYIYNGQTCPSGWFTQQINVAIFGWVPVDACYKISPCVVMYIYDGQSCPSGWTHQSIGAAVINNTITPVDACYKCN